jgi:hypothetical protein
MKNLKFLPIIMALFFIAASCSKEKQIERRLTSKDGKWNISSYSYTEYVNDVQVGATTSLSNVGTMEFKSGGSGVITFSIPGEPVETSNFTWSNSSDQITVTSDGETSIMKILEQSKKEMKLEQTYTYTFGGTNYKDVIGWTITK